MLLAIKAATKAATCPNCDSEQLVKDGKTSSGSQRYLCKSCGKSRVLNPKRTDYTDKQKERILRTYREGTSLRGLERIFGVARQTVSDWLKKKRRRP